MEPSPIELNPEQKKAYDGERVSKFEAEYMTLVEKHGIILKPILEATPDGIKPKLVHANYVKHPMPI